MALNRLSLPLAAAIMMINASLLLEGCLEEERIALLQIKTSIFDPNQNHFGASQLLSWGNDTLCSSWTGVSCDPITGRVNKIVLYNVRGWFIDPSMAAWSRDTSMGDWYLNATLFLPFQELKTLGLRNNYMAGCVANEGFERLSRLNKLEYLDLGLNNFNNSILSSLKGLSSLKHLFLDSNQLNGSIDTKDFDSLSKLEELDLSGNEIQNFVTSTAGSERSMGLNKLEILGLSFNKFNDSSLSFLEGLSSLKQLNIDNNQLKGPMAMKGLCELKQLQELDISHNDLNGLPSCLANLTNLQVLDISSNEFTGNISLSPIGSLTSIRDLNLSDNRFRIPISLGPFFNLSNLKNLNGDNNEIYESTELEHNLIPRFQLQRLSLACNGFGGTFPRFLYYQQDLLHVDLSYNKMTGEFPSWLLQNNTKLEELYLVNNSLSGSFQLPNRSHVNLSRLDISRNEIDNQIPTEIGSCFPRLVFLNLSRNHFGGSIPSSISNMSALDIIDLSNNRLSGNIPEQLVEGSLSLRVLVLSNNHLKGQLLWRSFNLAYLTDLILSGNQLTGILPDSLSNGSRLEALDVSLNNLTVRYRDG
uniref:Leucine-rich repeat-containing N-terminal plant-type domain-containing protein n=1 Tax=Salix viminalis TaxID=40686 RepID=A0A6N2M2T2_SALVM